MNIDAAVTLMEEVFGPFTPSDGVVASDLIEGERRLGIALPVSLRTLYLRTGRKTALHQSYDHLIAPHHWELERGRLLFYRENQSSCVWGVGVDSGAAPEPPVEIAYREGTGLSAWAPAFDNVSEFLAVEGAWQAVRGGLPFTALVTGAFVAGVAPRDDARGTRVKAEAQRQARERVATPDATVWTIEGCVLVYEQSHFFGLGGRDASSFLAASRTLTMQMKDWDYASIRDGA